MQSALSGKCSHTMAVRNLLGGGSVMVRRVRAFPVANEMGHVGVWVVVDLSVDSLPSMPF